MSNQYSVDEEVRVAQQYLRDYALPDGVRVVARPGKVDGQAVVQLTCHGPGGTRSTRRDPLGLWSAATDDEKAAMIRGLCESLALPG